MRGAIALGLLYALGTALDRALVLVPTSAPVRFPVRVVAALVFAYLALTLPWLLVVLLGVGWATRRLGAPAPTASLPIDKPLAAIALAVVVWLFSRPSTPFLWDEFVWLAKARMEASSPGMLVPEVLRPDSSAIPPGYPVLAPLACALLSGYAPATTALMRAANELTCAALVTFAFAFHAARLRPSAKAVAAIAVAAPLVLVHLRTAYVDVSVGLLAAALALLLEQGMLRAACVVALALAGLKDEGTLHVLAIVCVFARRDRVAVVPFAFAAAASIAWRVRLALHGIAGDHGLGVPHWTRLRDVAVETARDASDMWSWGCLWPVAFALVVVHLRGERGRGRMLATMLALQLTVLLGALVLGAERTIEFVNNGTLIDRMLVQLAPTAMLLVASSLPAAEARLLADHEAR